MAKTKTRSKNSSRVETETAPAGSRKPGEVSPDGGVGGVGGIDPVSGR
jgi:hypothetical protein